MGQVINFPQYDVEKRTMTSRIDGFAEQGKRTSAKVLFFTGVRYERASSQQRIALPSQRLLPPFPRG